MGKQQLEVNAAGTGEAALETTEAKRRKEKGSGPWRHKGWGQGERLATGTSASASRREDRLEQHGGHTFPYHVRRQTRTGLAQNLRTSPASPGPFTTIALIPILPNVQNPTRWLGGGGGGEEENNKCREAEDTGVVGRRRELIKLPILLTQVILHITLTVFICFPSVP